MNEAVPPAGPNPRALAADVLLRVRDGGATLDAALQAVLGGAAPERASAVRSLSYGAVRGYYRHDAILARLSSKPVRALDPPVRALLSVALYEIEDARTPQYAVVDAAVDAVKATAAARASGLVNAVLRRYLRERASVDAAVARDPASRYAAPAWLAARTRADWPARYQEVLAASDTQAPLWLRVDARRTTAEAYRALLEAEGRPARLAPQVPYALALEQPCEVERLPGFAQGLVSVQDLAAQCVQFPLALAPNLRILDACAAPGGKTQLIAERAADPAALVAVDVDAARLARVRENLERGAAAAQLVAGDASQPSTWWDGVPFDRILLDAPCSALGVVRRHPDIRLRRRPADLAKLPAQQLKLLAALWPLLAPGGRLVYATCTYTRAENRDLLQGFLAGTADAHAVPRAHWPGWPDIGTDDGIGVQLLPGEAGGDGFYYAALTKR